MLSGCSLFGTKIDVDATVTAIDRAPLVLPHIDEVDLDDIRWELITEENVIEAFKQLEEKGYDPVIFGITDDDYENLSLNQAKTFKLIMQQQAVINALKDYYMKKEKTDGTNNSNGNTE